MKRPSFWKDVNTEWYQSYRSKSRAESAVKELRRKGYNARIKEVAKPKVRRGRYQVWYRKAAKRRKG